MQILKPRNSFFIHKFFCSKACSRSIRVVWDEFEAVVSYKKLCTISSGDTDQFVIIHEYLLTYTNVWLRSVYNYERDLRTTEQNYK